MSAQLSAIDCRIDARGCWTDRAAGARGVVLTLTTGRRSEAGAPSSARSRCRRCAGVVTSRSTSTAAGEPAPPWQADPVRGLRADATPIGAARDAAADVARATAGTQRERDGERRIDLLLLLDAANKLQGRRRRLPVDERQRADALRTYKDLDQGCKLQERTRCRRAAGGSARRRVENGYWYSSDGQTARSSTPSLEEPIAGGRAVPRPTTPSCRSTPTSSASALPEPRRPLARSIARNPGGCA